MGSRATRGDGPGVNPFSARLQDARDRANERVEAEHEGRIDPETGEPVAEAAPLALPKDLVPGARVTLSDGHVGVVKDVGTDGTFTLEGERGSEGFKKGSIGPDKLAKVGDRVVTPQAEPPKAAPEAPADAEAPRGPEVAPGAAAEPSPPQPLTPPHKGAGPL